MDAGEEESFVIGFRNEVVGTILHAPDNICWIGKES